jgi:hypothetical protein
VSRQLMRRLAYRMVCYATRDERLNHGAWPVFFVRQLDSIKGDAKALVWSIGFAWGLRGERVIGSITPATNCLLLFPALYCSSQFLMRRLIWYGVPPFSGGQSNDSRGLLKLALCASLLAVVGGVAPGHIRRRVFVASAFPFMALTGLLSVACGAQLVAAAGLTPHQEIVLALIRGIIIGIVMTTVLTLPALLLYREVAAPVVMLSLLPAIARSHWTAKSQFGDTLSLEQLLWLAFPFVCTAIGVVIATAVCRRWQQYVLLPMAHPPNNA